MNSRIPLSVALLVAGALLAAGCSEGGSAGVWTPADEITVTGTVTAIDDRVPVDGGVTIALDIDGGGTTVLLFDSLFRDPPPTDQEIALYGKIKELVVGSRVRAVGQESDHGIDLEDLTILDP